MCKAMLPPIDNIVLQEYLCSTGCCLQESWCQHWASSGKTASWFCEEAVRAKEFYRGWQAVALQPSQSWQKRREANWSMGWSIRGGSSLRKRALLSHKCIHESHPQDESKRMQPEALLRIHSRCSDRRGQARGDFLQDLSIDGCNTASDLQQLSYSRKSQVHLEK